MAMSSAERQKKWRINHPEKANAIKQSHQLLKVEVLSHYGDGKCVCVQCGESRLACLSIDHINGGGNKQRQGKLRGSKGFYYWLRSSGYPLGFRTLCMNCQFIKKFEAKEG